MSDGSRIFIFIRVNWTGPLMWNKVIVYIVYAKLFILLYGGSRCNYIALVSWNFKLVASATKVEKSIAGMQDITAPIRLYMHKRKFCMYKLIWRLCLFRYTKMQSYPLLLLLNLKLLVILMRLFVWAIFQQLKFIKKYFGVIQFRNRNTRLVRLSGNISIA